MLQRKNNLTQYLPEFVYGGIDGAITTFAVVAGATGANLSSDVIIILGFSNLIADGFSMSIGNYLSSQSDQLLKKNMNLPVSVKSPLSTASTTFLSFNLIGLIPLLVYVANLIGFIQQHLFLYASILTAFGFVFIGALRSYITQTNLVKSILQTLSLGIVAATLAYFVGNILEHFLS